MKVAVVTPTIGSKYLQQCLSSVENQTYKNMTHYVFVDGDQYNSSVKSVTKDFNVKHIELQENVGKGWYGHRVYASCSFLVNAELICYLDEDNWFEPNHIETLVNRIKEKHLQWAFSLRKIYDKDGNFICDDNCESLGSWPVYFDPNTHHIDTSCFAVRQSVATKIGHAWYGQWGADRQFFYNLARNYTQYETTGEYTMCYRLDGNPGSVKKDFFETGNEASMKKYNGDLPWKK